MKKVFLLFFCLVIAFISSYCYARGPVGVSPGWETAEAVIQTILPTFSWSAVEGAVGYRLEVFRASNGDLGGDEIARSGELVMRVDIPAPALSWSMSGGEGLRPGESYVWYVKAIDSNGEGQWSQGNRFIIDTSSALEAMEGAVREKVREFVRTDSELRTAIMEIRGEAQSKSGSYEGKEASPEKGTQQGLEGPLNTLYGQGAGNGITTGTNNTFIGNSAGFSTTAGSYNTFLGHFVGYSNTEGNANTFLGDYAGYKNTTGYGNVFVGENAGSMNTTGHHNTMVGLASGSSNTEGFGNTILGYYAGYSNAAGNFNTFLGYNAGYYETGSNKLYIHNSGSSDPLIYGEFDKRVVKINGTLNIAAVASPSDMVLKKDIRPLEGSLEKVVRLQGVSYKWRTDQYPGKGFSSARQIGLIAQDVEKVLPELVATDKDGKKSLYYDRLTAVLIEALKAQQAQIKAQREEMDAQRARLEAQRTEMEAQRAAIRELKTLLQELISRGI